MKELLISHHGLVPPRRKGQRRRKTPARTVDLGAALIAWAVSTVLFWELPQLQSTGNL